MFETVASDSNDKYHEGAIRTYTIQYENTNAKNLC